MIQDTVKKKIFSFLMRVFLFGGLFCAAYLVGIQGWALPFIPFFLILLCEEKKLPSLVLGLILFLQDVAGGYWLGTHLFLYGGLAFLVMSQKRFVHSHKFLFTWIFFILMVFVLILARQIMGFWAFQSWPSTTVLFYEFTILGFLFPLFSYFLPQQLHQKRAANQ